ncbi:MAG: 5'-deoxynucleotidase [Lachnospiraceae bacterium]|nr:5'-deoxynucleotidase [Lachnospiraceae bacterium]MBR6274282.1 5'-deoxynucleotidase [Lachnospiraceae bacterium]
MSNHFYAMMSRMKYIERWALMRNSEKENISEHSLEVAMIAHGLAVIGNVRFGKNYNPERCALIAMYHDSSEIITGDMPTPIKYYNNSISGIYHEIEDKANETLLSMLPEDIRESYKEYFFRSEKDEELWKLVKAADKLSALVKCIEEENFGNREFSSAKEATRMAIKEMNIPEADEFLREFMPSYSLTLDNLR